MIVHARKVNILVAALGVLLMLAPPPALARGARSHASEAPTPATNWRQIHIPPLPAFQPRLPKRVVLHNGMVVFLTEDHELPLISGSAIIRGGAASEPAAKTGLVALYTMSWRTGGTERLTGDQLDDFLEARAAKVETSGGDEHTSIRFDCLKGDFPQVFGVFADLLRHPAFREAKLLLAKKELDSSISRRNDETGSIAAIQTDILGYGKQSAYARIPEYATVAAVNRRDLVDWYRTHVTPNNIVLGIVGDFDSGKMEAALNRAFGDWQPGAAVTQPKVAIQPAKPGIYLVDKTDVDQSQIRVIGLGIERRSPDYYPLQVMNEILGGGFSSRLFVNLRTKAGLAYAVGGGVGSDWDHPGLAIFQIGTKTETTVEALRGLRQQLEQMRQAPPSEAEMKRAKDAILNSFIFRFDTPAKVLHEQERYEFFGYPSDFLQRYRAGVEKVTAAEVQRVARKYLHPDAMKVLVVGNAAGFQKQLAEMGPVTPVDITIPSASAKPAAAPASTPAAAAQSVPPPPAMAAPMDAASAAPAKGQDGTAAVEKLAQYMGGDAKIAAVKSLRQHYLSGGAQFPVKVERNIVYPDREAEKIQLPQGELLQVITPSAAFTKLAGHLRKISPAQQQSELDALKRDFLSVLQHIHDPKYSFRLVGKQMLANIDATVVDVNADGLAMRWWISPKGFLMQETFTANNSDGPRRYMTRFYDWREIDGLRYPTRQTTDSEGEPQTMMMLGDMQINPQIDPAIFEEPKL